MRFESPNSDIRFRLLFKESNTKIIDSVLTWLHGSFQATETVSEEVINFYKSHYKDFLARELLG